MSVSKPEHSWRELLDERQAKEVELSTLYARDFHHGTTGHNQLMLIAWLADALDRVEASGMPIHPLFFPKDIPG